MAGTRRTRAGTTSLPRTHLLRCPPGRLLASVRPSAQALLPQDQIKKRERLLTGNTDTKMVASSATIKEMRASVSITAYSFFPGFHSTSPITPCSSLDPSRLDDAVLLVVPGYTSGFQAIVVPCFCIVASCGGLMKDWPRYILDGQR